MQSNRSSNGWITMLLATSLSIPAAVCAGDVAPPAATAAPVVVTGIGPALSADALDGYRGGADTVSNDIAVNGEVSGNSAEHVVGGSNAISDGAFANSSGIATVIQNSGTNVLIQNAMVVNVQFLDPGP